MLGHNMEHYIRKLLTGEAQKNALEFTAYLRANDMPPVRFKDNYWKDKCYWAVRVNGEYVCFVLLNGSPAQDKTEPEGWVIWSDDTETAANKWYEDAPIDDRMKEIAWQHVDCCNCGTVGNPARRRSIFGKDFEPVCASIFRFDNLDAEALECAKKMAELRKNDILGRAVAMKHIDPKVLADYNRGVEKNRLRKDLGLIEFARTKELLLEHLPPPPAVIYDIGGGYGEYAWWLASQGYDVHLFDISQTHIAMSAALGEEYPGVSLRSAEVADAVQIDRPGASADAVLCMGPLYHITQESGRLAALMECRRLLRPGGRLFTAAITPYATLLWATTVYGAENRLLEEEAFLAMCAHELETGAHIPPEDSAYRGIGRSFFHAPDALERELAAGGFADITLHGVVGAGWLAPDLDEKWNDPTAREAIMRTVRMLDGRRDILGLSTHLLAAARKPEEA